MLPQDFKAWRDNCLNKTAASALVMGILNVTPDSFYDGNRYTNAARLSDRVAQMLHEGVDIIDVGGESTRPGAEPVSIQEELYRVIPAIEAIRAQTDMMISIDTTKPEVMEAALAQGASMINDVSALSHHGALEVIAKWQVPVCLMHRQGTPQTMQTKPQYPEGVLSALLHYFKARKEACLLAGIEEKNLMFDPGIGFGKSLEHNLFLLACLDALCKDYSPVLIGVSRKSFLGEITAAEVQERLGASLGANVYAYLKGAAIFRVHDVAQTKQALQVAEALQHQVKH